MNGNLNNAMNDLMTENDIAKLFLHLSDGYIFDIIQNNIDDRVPYVQTHNPNIVYSLNQSFKNIESQYSIDKSYYDKMNETYLSIIQILCGKYNISINLTNETDLYTAAFYMYDFLVSNFYNCMIQFFVKFIMNEKNFIYNSMNLNNVRKNKDSSTVYCKKVLSDPKVAIISANLEDVLNNMIAYDIGLDTIIRTVYTDPVISNYLSTLITSNTGLFFKEQYGFFLNSDKRPTIITNIRYAIQQECGVVDNPNIIS